VLQVEHLRKRYLGGNGVWREVLRDISFAVQPGECFGLLGPNGAGKTTTLRLLLGLSAPDGGQIHMLGHAIPQHARVARQHIGVVPQLDNLDPDFSVAENLLVYGRYFGLGDALIRSRIPELLAFAGLEGRDADAISALSGGMKRRLTLARALVNDPQLIFLDEPTTGLDPQARHLIWQRLKLLINKGKTIILTTHFMDEAERLCGRLAIMDEGGVVAQDAPRALIRAHIEPQVIEVHGDGVEAWASGRVRALAQRLEQAGETVFCYTSDPQPVLDTLQDFPGLQHLQRSANLEDVFLKLTGRDLRD